jgi:hypothetical protein
MSSSPESAKAEGQSNRFMVAVAQFSCERAAHKGELRLERLGNEFPRASTVPILGSSLCQR